MFMRFDYVFINTYSFTKFIILDTAPRLFTNTILLKHTYLYQRTMHCPPLAYGCMAPCIFHFQVIHSLLSNHTPPACGVVPNQRCPLPPGPGGSALQELHCPLPQGSVVVHCRSTDL